jgi:hypothetical protein
VKLRHLNPTTANDYRRMIALWEAAGLTHKPRGRDAQEAIERQIAGGTHTFIGAETEAGELVGTVLATHDGRKGWINRLAVHPDYLLLSAGYVEWPGLHYVSKRDHQDV